MKKSVSTEKKLSNEENIKNLKKRERLRIVIMCFSVLTIVLAMLNLFYDVSIVWAILSFIVTTISSKVREKTPIRTRDELKEVRKEIEENKKKFGKK